MKILLVLDYNKMLVYRAIAKHLVGIFITNLLSVYSKNGETSRHNQQKYSGAAIDHIFVQ